MIRRFLDRRAARRAEKVREYVGITKEQEAGMVRLADDIFNGGLRGALDAIANDADRILDWGEDLTSFRERMR